MRIVGHGIDMVEIARLASLLEAHGDRFLERVFTAGERSYADAGAKRRLERYGVRFAAKEAGMKALGTGWRSGIAWTDFEVMIRPSGQPALHVDGRAAEIARELRIDWWEITLSHTSTNAIASVIAISRS